MPPPNAMADPESKAPRLPLSLADFELLRRIGDGSYSHVVLARQRSTGREYALKVIDKQYIMRHKVVEYIRQERQILDTLQYDDIAALYFTFQDAYSLYLGLEYCPNGELYDQIRLKGTLDEASARLYTAEVVLMLEHLRRHRVVHRDLKPENLLLDAQGHLKLIDFGSAKQLTAAEVTPEPQLPAASTAAEAAELDPKAAAGGAATAGAVGDVGAGAAGGEQQQAQQEASQAAEAGDGYEAAVDGQAPDGGAAPAAASGDHQQPEQQEEDEVEEEGTAGLEGKKRAVSLVGTADYVSPEILNNRPVSCAADLWALGCVLYQMLVGTPPFKTPSEYLTFQKIVEADYALPDGASEESLDLITRLLQLEPAERVGAFDLSELRAHPFFHGIDWGSLRSQQPPEFELEPDMDPALSSAGSSFDWELQSLASALPRGSAEDTLELEKQP